MESAHNTLVKKLGLKNETYNARLLKGVPDKDNPLDEINKRCLMLQKFLDIHSGFNKA